MARQIDELVAERTASSVVGRDDELAQLLGLLQPDGPIVAFVHGIAGIGKSTLLRMFASQARSRGARVIEIDGSNIEPSSRGFEAALSASIGLDPLAAAVTINDAIADIDQQVVIIVDVYERLRLLDTWLRQEFVARLPAGCRVVVAGRDRPLLGWTAVLAGAGAFLDVALEGLSESDALAMLASSGLDERRAVAIIRLARGHPLALQLVSELCPTGAMDMVVNQAKTRLINELASAYVGDLPADVRAVVEAASVVRRMTRSLLRAMVPGVPTGDAFERLAGLPFVTRTEDGLAVHDLVRDIVQGSLRADDPVAYADYRRAAWEQLTAEARSIGSSSLWRYTADMLSLIDNPAVREAFFPMTTEFLAVEPARADDGPQIVDIATSTESPAAGEALTSMWATSPDRFSVVRDADGTVAGFYVMGRADQMSPSVVDAHPVMRQWREHLRRHPVASGELVLYMPRWLTRDLGEQACAAQAASWLDVKRSYMELRPRLRRVYTSVVDLSAWAPVVLPLGFVPLPEHAVDVDGVTFHTAMLDFGPGSVDGWLAMRVAGELGVTAAMLDPHDRTVRTSTGRVPLTRLEFGVLEMLHSRPGTTVTRQQLLASVWGSDYTEGSNVVDAVVRTLRHKLGDEGSRVETVRGLGYRLGT